MRVVIEYFDPGCDPDIATDIHPAADVYFALISDRHIRADNQLSSLDAQNAKTHDEIIPADKGHVIADFDVASILDKRIGSKKCDVLSDLVAIIADDLVIDTYGFHPAPPQLNKKTEL